MDWAAQDYINIELDSNRNQLIRVRPRSTTLLCRSGTPRIGHPLLCIDCKIRRGMMRCFLRKAEMWIVCGGWLGGT